MSGLSDGALSIAICQRCGFKVDYKTLLPDGNSPGLKVCPSCYDVKDPWRYPARKADALALMFPRPDISVADEMVILTDNQGNDILTSDGSTIEVTG